MSVSVKWINSHQSLSLWFKDHCLATLTLSASKASVTNVLACILFLPEWIFLAVNWWRCWKCKQGQLHPLLTCLLLTDEQYWIMWWYYWRYDMVLWYDCRSWTGLLLVRRMSWWPHAEWLAVERREMRGKKELKQGQEEGRGDGGNGLVIRREKLKWWNFFHHKNTSCMSSYVVSRWVKSSCFYPDLLSSELSLHVVAVSPLLVYFLFIWSFHHVPLPLWFQRGWPNGNKMLKGHQRGKRDLFVGLTKASMSSPHNQSTRERELHPDVERTK